MAGCFGNSKEDRAREAELNRYLDKQNEGEALENLVEDMMNQAVTDAALFRTYDDDFEVIDRDQVMRCLANLDHAIRGLNIINNIAITHPVSGAELRDIERATVGIDAIFTALRIMQDNLKSAVEHEAKNALNNRIWD